MTVSKNEILTAFNEPERWILALVEVPPEEETPADVGEELMRDARAAYHAGDGCRVRYVRRPFTQEPDFHVTSVNYDWKQLWQMGEEPT